MRLDDVAGGEGGAVQVFDLQDGSLAATHPVADDTVNGFSFHPWLPLAAVASGLLAELLPLSPFHEPFWPPCQLVPCPEADDAMSARETLSMLLEHQVGLQFWPPPNRTLYCQRTAGYYILAQRPWALSKIALLLCWFTKVSFLLWELHWYSLVGGHALHHGLYCQSPPTF